MLDEAEDEDKFLAAGIVGLQQNGYYMQRALDSNNLREALKYSAQMLSELRTSKLSPHKYYELYMRAFDQLRKLEAFFVEESRRRCSIVDLYELVQHAGNILPRMDADSVMDAVEFVLLNFTEMNKLWVRMQHQGLVQEKERQEKERSELSDLVGKNLHVLSQIEGVDLDIYKVNCKDELAQIYLTDCLIQVFPDEYHLQTLDIVLGAFPQLLPSVDIKTVMSQLMERLSNYAASSAEVLPEFLQVEAFSKLSNAIVKVIEAQADMPTIGIVTLYSSLLTFTLHVHPDRLDYADQVLGACVRKFSGKGKIEDNEATKQIVALLSAPLEQYNDIVTALKLSNYPRVMEFLNISTNKVMAAVIIQSIMKNRTCITTPDKVEALFELIKGLLKDSDATSNIEDKDDFKEEQNCVACLIQMFYNDDPKVMFKIIDIVRKHILTGGLKPLPFTVPPFVFSSLKLVRQLQGQDEDPFGDNASTAPKKIFQLLNQTIETLSGVPAPELALPLYLQCAEAANDCDLEPVAYEFFTQACILYEEEISDSREQITAMHLIVGTLQRIFVFGVENRDTLNHKATGYSAKLLKKPDQCRAVYACSHLFWLDDHGNMKDGERVLSCLKRALRIANAAQQMPNAARGSTGSVMLFIEILNKYLYFFEKGNPQVTVATIQGLIELVMTEMQSETTTPDPGAEAFFASTLRYIQFQKQKGGAVGQKYEPIKV